MPTLADFDAVEAQEGTETGGPYASIVFQHRFGSGSRHVRRLLAEQASGARSSRTARPPGTGTPPTTPFPGAAAGQTEGGGPAMGHGIHQMDLLLDLLGPWSEVRAMAGRLVHDVETEDVSTALVRFENGALATVVNSVLSPDEVSRIRIDCERATVELTHLYGHSNANWRITPAPDVPDAEAAAWRDFGADVPSSHLAQLRELVASMRAGERPRSSGADGRTSLELIAALYKSAFTDATVRAGEIGPGDPYYAAHARRRPRLGARNGPMAPTRAPSARVRSHRMTFHDGLRVVHAHGDRITVTEPVTGVELLSYVYRAGGGLGGAEAVSPPDADAGRGRRHRLPAQRPPLAQGPAADGLAPVGAEPVGRQLLRARRGVSRAPERVGSMAHVGFDEVVDRTATGSSSPSG